MRFNENLTIKTYAGNLQSIITREIFNPMYYFLITLLLLAIEILYFRLADRFNIIDKPNERSSHTRITLRGGGIIFYFGALVYFLTNHFAYPWFMLGLTAITLISFIDDIHSVSRRLRLLVHFTALLLIFHQWNILDMPLWYIPLALIICTGIINAYNFMDGINGITGGYSLVTLLTLACLNHYVVSFVAPDLIWTTLIAVLVFNFFNFRKKAKCFAGDVGSVSIAFILLFLIGTLIFTTNDWGFMILLAVYGTDAVLTIIHRIMLHEHIGQAHRKHLYQIMANELKIPHIAVSSLYMALQLLISAGYIYIYVHLPEYRYYYFGITLVVLSAGYGCFMKRYFKLHLK